MKRRRITSSKALKIARAERRKQHFARIRREAGLKGAQTRKHRAIQFEIRRAPTEAELAQFAKDKRTVQ